MQSLSGRSNSQTLFFAAAGFFVGVVAWSGHLYTLLALLLLPVLLPLAIARTHFFALVVAYHAGATWTLLPGSHVFYGTAFRPLDTLLLWLATISILTLPWLLIRLLPPARLAWTLPLVLVVASLLPTGIESPLTVAGVLFPGLGWLGLILTLAIYGTMTRKPLRSLGFAVCLFAVCHLVFHGHPQAPPTWTGIDTRFGGTGFMASNGMASYRDALAIQSLALESPATVTVFPETVVKSWNSATDLFWQPTFHELETRGRTVIVGAEESGISRRTYFNVLIVRGAQTDIFRQRVPIPFAMWNPFNNTGVPLNLSGPSTITIGATRVAPIICYEQLLALPILTAMTKHPALILGVANDYWARDTSIPRIQAASLSAWSRLFWVPTISAVNQ
jgi:hypothetical protein